MTYELIRTVESWLNTSRDRLQAQGIEIDERIPAADDEVPWKASISFVHKGQVVTLTVWQRHVNEADIIALDMVTGCSFPIGSLTSEQINDISGTLDGVIDKLLTEGYRDR